MLLAGIVITLITISSCDETTGGIGGSLTDESDLFSVETALYDVLSRSVVVDSVISRSEYTYLGRLKDPETGAYITCDFTTQFNVLEKEKAKIFPPEADILSREGTEVIADSCILEITIDSWVGDSLAAQKLTVYELDRPVSDNAPYFSNFDPEKEGYIRSGGLKQKRSFSLSDLELSDSVRKLRNSDSYYFSIRIPLQGEYTDKSGKTYNNYGTYLMRQYYANHDNYKNSYNFAHKVCPGFYLKMTDGSGLMTEIFTTRLAVHYRYTHEGVEYATSKHFYSTEEVMQTTHVVNDQNTIKILAEEEEHTYLKTPAGIFTEVTLPVDEIKAGHEQDTIASAKITFFKLNDKSELTDKLLADPTYLLMIERDSLYSFFKGNNSLHDNKTSFLCAMNYSKNTYTYNNISTLINFMYDNKLKGGASYTTEHPNWNKVVLVPVDAKITESSYASSTITGLNNLMSISSSRLKRGTSGSSPIKISVIYNKTKH